MHLPRPVPRNHPHKFPFDPCCTMAGWESGPSADEDDPARIIPGPHIYIYI